MKSDPVLCEDLLCLVVQEALNVLAFGSVSRVRHDGATRM